MPESSAGEVLVLRSSMKSGDEPRAKISLSWMTGADVGGEPKENVRSGDSKEGWPSRSVKKHFQK
jgi:hypothetical protein